LILISGFLNYATYATQGLALRALRKILRKTLALRTLRAWLRKPLIKGLRITLRASNNTCVILIH